MKWSDMVVSKENEFITVYSKSDIGLQKVGKKYAYLKLYRVDIEINVAWWPQGDATFNPIVT